jgi:ergothioneine biosynthesis protein EgtC
MCRFLAYRGAPILLDKLVYAPRHSLVRQSYRANESDEPLNGDGFGIGWYVPDADPTPAVFVSVRPAWSDRNLRSIASKIRSGTVFAHVRAASTGLVSESNCHPFAYKQFLFMHNGNIDGFEKIKRRLRRELSDTAYDWVQGQTDSEHFFALLLTLLERKGWPGGPAALAETVEEALAFVRRLKREERAEGPSTLNLAVTNGQGLVAMRYVSDRSKAPTLYYTAGSRYECRDGIARMEKAEPSEHAVLVVSERLTARKEDWKEIRPNTFLIVDENLGVALRPVRERPARKG